MIAENACWEWLLRRAAQMAAESGCWKELLRVAAGLWIKASWKRNLSSFYVGYRFGRHRRETTLSCSSDAENCGEMRSLHFAGATLSSLWARRTSKTVVKCKSLRLPTQPSRQFVLVGRPKLTVMKCEFSGSSRNHVIVSCSSDVQNCETQIFPSTAQQPSRQFVLVGRLKLW